MKWTYYLKDKLPKLTKKNVDNHNSSITNKVIELVFLNLPHNKIPNPNGFTDELYPTKYLKKY